MDLLYTQQFSLEQTPLKKLLPILRQHAGDGKKLRGAIASAFFKDKATPDKIAANTLIALKAHGFIERTPEASLTDLGNHMVAQSEEGAAVTIAKNILKTHGGFQLVETLKEMRDGGHDRTLNSIAAALRENGLQVSSNSSDLSNLTGWLRLAGIVVNQWDVDDKRYGEIVGVETATIGALKNLDLNQIAFLRAMLALGTTELTLYTEIVDHAEKLFSGQTSFNRKSLEQDLVRPLEAASLINVQRARKSSEKSRGGKPALVSPSKKFEIEIAAPMLESLFRNSHIRDLRKIRSTPWHQVVANIKQNKDVNLKGQALEILSAKFCLLLGLEFIGIRKTDESMTAGGEVDAILQSTGLIFSRWQIQCKATDKITYEMIAKEYGVAAVTLASVIMIVSTGRLTPGAERYRTYLIQKTPLNVIVIEGDDLEKIVAKPLALGEILQRQAERARRIREQPMPIEAPAAVPSMKASSTDENLPMQTITNATEVAALAGASASLPNRAAKPVKTPTSDDAKFERRGD